jgi:hypothetical protein
MKNLGEDSAKYEKSQKKNDNQSIGGRVVVWVGAENRMGITVIPHDAIEMTMMKDVIQDLGHRVRGAGCPINLEEAHEPMLDPFLGGNVLNVEVTGVTAGTTMIGNGNGSGVVFGNESGLSNGEPQVTEKLAKICDALSGVATSDDLSLRKRESGGAFDDLH